MRRLSSALAVAVISIAPALAQTLHIKNGAVTYSFSAYSTGEMLFSASGAINVCGREIPLTDNTEGWVDNETVEDNTVRVVYSGQTAKVDIAGNIARYVDASVDGARVAITQSGESLTDPIIYCLTGTSADGSLSLAGADSSEIHLEGLDLTSLSGAAIEISGKGATIFSAPGTVNTLADAAGGSQKGCIVGKGYIGFAGTGTLNVAGLTSHAVYAKNEIRFKESSLRITAAVKDGLNCNRYFIMESGDIDIAGIGDDALQVSYLDETDRANDDTGSITISGGHIKAVVTADAAKGLKCEGDMIITGGTADVSASGNGVWDSAKVKTKASACLASDGDITLDGGTITLSATGGGGKGINCDGRLTINSGKTAIRTSGGIVAYVNGTLYTNYTGNTDRLDSDMKSSPKGIKADGDIEINGGEIDVTTTGKGAEGIESKSVLTVNDGTITVASTDDAINSSSHMYLKGGTITVVASGNDGLDSNGNMYIQGGYIMAFGTSSPECGIDANEEEGYTVVFTGGTLLAVGGGNSVPSSSSGSTQPYVAGSGTPAAGNEITLADSQGQILASFKVPDFYTASGNQGGGNRPGRPGGNGGSVLITCPGLQNGSNYALKIENTDSTVTARLTGSGSGPGGRP